MATETEKWSKLSDAELLDAIGASTIPQEQDVIEEILVGRKMAALKEAVGDFIGATAIFIDLTQKLNDAISSIGHAPQLEKILARVSDLQQVVTDANRLSNTEEDQPEEEESDEAREPVEVKAKPKTGKAKAITSVPKTSKSRQFEELEQEYLDLFASMTINAAKDAQVGHLATRAAAKKSTYEGVGTKLGIPWWFIAAVHMMESGFNFATHLHNGDPLTDVTKQVPKGRPKHRKPPPAFSWAESAEDALANHRKLAGLKDWSLARTLYRLEAYNGFGYRNRQMPTPYLWSFSNLYDKGKFVKDGVFDGNARSGQCGAAALIWKLRQTGMISLDGEIQEEDSGVKFEAEIKAAETVSSGPLGGSSFNADFNGWFAENVPDVTHFRGSEFLFKGAAHAQNGLNTDPPKDLWPNVIPLARVLEALRREIGKPIKLLSIYRSPDYNKSVKGAANSIHMQFKAADFAVIGPGAGKPRDWAKIVDRMRWHDGMFTGGRGLYSTFVHVDVRGTNNSWPATVPRDLS